MPLPLPKAFHDAFVREGGHGEPRMCDAEATFLVSQYGSCGFNRLTFALGIGEGPSLFDAVLQDQLMHITHGCIQQTISLKGKWDSTDASYSKDISFKLLVSSVESSG